ncbi:uncharacterized protein LOC122942002 [Bufo gargarizans]|uniref:uncharacterized protein LOC122942002 n=1 Tax=Bufo gargarizans TaxID=30331 RepID=UPI001CF19A28|nr:uncharacterized protein LOC122942002 [Bufo gargarizans]
MELARSKPGSQGGTREKAESASMYNMRVNNQEKQVGHREQARIRQSQAEVKYQEMQSTKGASKRRSQVTSRDTNGRSTQLLGNIPVPRTALSGGVDQRRSREEQDSVEEGPLAVGGAEVSSRCPSSVVQRVVQVVRDEEPSTSRSRAGEVSVLRESGSAAAGGTAPVVPGLRTAALVWILGHSYVFWGAIRADVRPSGRQLGFSSELATVRWLGVRGMLWGGVLREVHRFVRLDRPPDVLVLHVGGNDLGRRPFRELIRDVKFDLLRIWALFPGLITVWSDIVPRKAWRGARSVESLNKARVKVNRAVGRFMAKSGGVVVRHEVLEKGVGEFWRADGVHLNAVGTDLWALGLQSGVEVALETMPQGTIRPSPKTRSSC